QPLGARSPRAAQRPHLDRHLVRTQYRFPARRRGHHGNGVCDSRCRPPDDRFDLRPRLSGAAGPDHGAGADRLGGLSHHRFGGSQPRSAGGAEMTLLAPTMQSVARPRWTLVVGSASLLVMVLIAIVPHVFGPFDPIAMDITPSLTPPVAGV